MYSYNKNSVHTLGPGLSSMNKNQFGVITLLLVKSVYSLLLIRFENEIFQNNTFKFLILLSIFNHFIAFFLACAEGVFRSLKRIFISTLIAWLMVVLSGSNAVSWNSLAFAFFFSSVAFNSLHFNSTNAADILNSLYKLDLKALINGKRSDLLQVGLIFSTFTSCIGALMSGLIVILDWNEGWQAFPLPNTIGCLIGEFCGLLLTLLVMMMMKTKSK